MAEEKFKVTETGVDTDAVADAIRESAPSAHSEFSKEFDIGSKERISNSSKPSFQSSESVGAKGYNNPTNVSHERSSSLSRDAAGSHRSSLSKDENNLQKNEQGGSRRNEHVEPTTTPVATSAPSGTPAPVNNMPHEGVRPGNGYQGIPRESGIPTGNGNPSLNAPNSGLDTGEGLNKGTGKGNKMPIGNNNGQKELTDDGDEEKSAKDQKKEEKERADKNNANNIRNAADVAMASKNPYAMAAGGAVKAADKITGGKSTEMLGKAMTTANRFSPGGRRIQNASNKLNESGASDKIGKAAAAKSGDASKGASKAGESAKKAADAKNKSNSVKKPDPKRAKSSKEAGAADGDANRTESERANMDGITRAIAGFFVRHPFALITLILLLLLFFLLLTSNDFKAGSGTNQYCSYELNGVVSSGSVKLDNVQVELINCDGNASNYTVLETIDFEKYVVGVALAEVSWSKDNPEYFKSQIVAARGFALKRNAAMCPSNPDNCFYGYNAETGKIRLRACTNDQVYCDIDKPCYHVTRSGKPTIYGPEAEGMSGATVWKNQLSDTTKAEILAAAEEVKGKVLVDDSGNVVYTNFINTDQQHWNELAKQGKNYEQILVEHYSSANAKGMNSATCSSYGNIDYGNYQLTSEGDTILNERLDKFLESKGTSLEQFNKLIESNVQKNGYGTRAGVVTAAVTLIAELGNNYHTKVPYFLSGGHHDGVKQGALGYWGSGVEDDGTRCYYTGYGNVYTVCGLDCSGFVPWAIKNGGFQVGVRLAGDFQNMDGAKRVSLSSSSAVLEPGDLLESEGHIVLVVGIDESSSQYICAEASGKNSGVLFTRRPFTGGSGYWGVKMDGYYDKYSLKGK